MRGQAKQHFTQEIDRITRVFGVVGAILALLTLSACGSDSGDGIDPGIIEVPLAYIKRPIPVDEDGNEIQPDLRDPRFFAAGGDVYYRTNSAIDADTFNLTRSVTRGRGDVKGLNTSYDGRKVIFSLRLEDPDPLDDEVPSWNIYEYDFDLRELRMVIPPSIAEDADDLYPAYLPDDRIVFTSSRQEQFEKNLQAEGKPIYPLYIEETEQKALALHVMEPDGSNIRQISPNATNELYPLVLTSNRAGKIIFTRWDNRVVDRGMHLYITNPDGSEMELYYGRNSHATGTNDSDIHFTNLREMPNGDLIVIGKPYTGTFDGGEILLIDAENFIDYDKRIWSQRKQKGGRGHRAATSFEVATDGSLSLNGRFSSAFPLQDGTNRLLVSRASCQVNDRGEIRPCEDDDVDDPGVEEASPSYGIWLYDLSKQTARPIILAEEGQVITEALTLQKNLRPEIIFDKSVELVDAWETARVGAINIKSVYDSGDRSFDGCYFDVCVDDLVGPGETVNINSVEDFSDPAKASAKHRPARFIRFYKVSIFPDEDDPAFPDLRNNAFGRNLDLGMREIMGYAPVEPDGSVKVKVPANVPLAFEILDAGGRRIGPRHDDYFQVLAGDTLTCNGCHDPGNGNETPNAHTRQDARAPSINGGVDIDQNANLTELPNTEIPGTGTPYFIFDSEYDSVETLAEVRFARAGAQSPPAPEPELSADLIYQDYWTAGGLARPDLDNPLGPDPTYVAAYDALDVGSLNGVIVGYANRPVRSPLCNATTPSVVPWTADCRIAVSYPRHIHPIWSRPRGLTGPALPDDDFIILPTNPADGVPLTPLNVMNDDGDLTNGDGIADGTCVSCHNTTINAMAAIPYGQLDLSSDPAQDPDDRYPAYIELLFNDQAHVLANMGTMIDTNSGIGWPRSMNEGGARSSYFIEKMTGVELDNGRPINPGPIDHTMLLSPVEIKLISEWLDMGAQNFNDLFDPAAPQN